MSATSEPIDATLVGEHGRLEFLPTLLGRLFMHVEAAVYTWMRALCADYGGGYWEFVALSNSGGYLRPSTGPWLVSVDGNGWRGELSADAVGIVVTLFALGHLTFRYPESDITDRYQQLLAYARQHAESGRILAAID